LTLRQIIGCCVFLFLSAPAWGQVQTLNLWHSYTAGEREALELVVKNFQKHQPKLQVEVSFVPFNALADKLTAAIPRGHGPDLFIFAHDRVGGWAEGRLLEPIELLVDEPMLDKHVSQCVFALAYGDSLYGLPLAFKSLALFIRTDLIQEIPIAIDHLFKLAQQHTDRTKGRFGFVYPAGDLFFHTPLLYSMGGTIFDGHSQIPNVDNKGVIRSLAIAKRINELGILPDDPSPVVASSMFVSGRTPMIINGPWFLDSVKGKIPFRVAPIPAFYEGQASSGFSSCEGVFMNRRSKKKKPAFELMSFLSNDITSATIRMKMGRQTVTLDEAWSKGFSALDKESQSIFLAFKQAFERSHTSPSFPNMNAVWGPMNAALYNTLHKNVSPQEAAQDAQRRIEKALAH
jgi:maltose-binding protein MalE